MKTEELRSLLLGIINDYPEKACWTVSMAHLKILVDKTAETEREACAKIADDFDPEQKMSNYGQIIASRIRARG